jgi:hypothetical protein
MVSFTLPVPLLPPSLPPEKVTHGTQWIGDDVPQIRDREQKIPFVQPVA